MVRLRAQIKHYKILTKTVETSWGDWEHKPTAALWAYRTVYKVVTHCTPFSLAFGLEAVMPMEYLVGWQFARG